ncbi:MAG TPA: glutathione S-transferase family protein [Candidatus Binatia bacterium]|jgi:glutathione S-transferase|nr:glutathione S-transferase family protein [Candidatus Binatia bacterium]
MILIGQYDSPFVRRVAVALHLYGMPYEHRPWSVFGDADELAAYNPLRRVPTLVLDDGEVLIESSAMLDAIDDMVGRERALIPASGPSRRKALKVCALATGLADKAVALVYERVLHERNTPVWTARCRSQIGDVLDVLEADRAARPTTYWFGDAIGHADVAVACALRFVGEAHPDVVDLAAQPALAAHATRCEALAPFQAVQQAFKVTLPA